LEVTVRRSSVAFFIVVGLIIAGLPAAAQTADLFEPDVTFDVGSWPEAVAVGDVNGDGRVDVVMTTSYYFDPANDYRLFVFLQDQNGALQIPASYPTVGTYTSRPDSVGVGDVTGDGLADVVVGVEETGIEVFPQEPDGTLGAGTVYPTSDAFKIRLGDLNNDGRLDVAGVGWGTDTATVFLQNSTGTFDGSAVYPVSHSGYEDLEIGDVTGDGLADIVVMSGQLYATPNLGILAQRPAGGFDSPDYYRVGENTNTRGVGVGDATGDGRNDVVVTFGGNRPASHVGVFAQNGSGTLDPVVAYSAYDIPEPVEVVDLDIDGRADVVTAHGGWSRVGVFRQTSTGALATEELYPVPYASHYNPHGLAVGDVNGDGASDVVMADYNSGLVVLYNTTDMPPEPGEVDLGVELTPSAKSIKRGNPFSFSVEVFNYGPDDAAEVELSATVSGPHGTLTAGDPDCSVSGDQLACVFDSLASGAGRSVVISGVGTAKGALVASAVVTSIDHDDNSANNKAGAKIRVR
jgi:hypothetical protein